MPAQRPSASFEPISPDLDLAALVEETPNFEYVVRISYDMIESQGLEAFEKLVLLHVIIGGKPLVIEGFHRQLDSWSFASQWLQDNLGKKCTLPLLRAWLVLAYTCVCSRTSTEPYTAAKYAALDRALLEQPGQSHQPME